MVMAATGADKEAAIVAAYLAGRKVTDIETEFGVGRSSIYHFLRRSGVVPQRTQRKVLAESKDAALAGLYGLIEHQDRRIAEQEAEIAELRKQMAAANRKLRKLDGGPIHNAS